MAVATLDVRSERVEDVLEETARRVFAGNVVVYPEETGYVAACDPQHADAVARLYATADGAAQPPVVLCLASPAEFLEYAQDNPLALLAAKRLLPAPLVMIVRRPAFFDDAQTAGRLTVGLRIPQDPLAHAILDRCGPLMTCNVERDDLPLADLLLERGEVAPSVEMSVVDLTGTRAQLLREGAVPFERLAARFGPIDRHT